MRESTNDNVLGQAHIRRSIVYVLAVALGMTAALGISNLEPQSAINLALILSTGFAGVAVVTLLVLIMYFRVLSVRPSFEGALETSEEDVSSVESLRIVLRVLIEYEGALETVLMLADRGPLDMRDLEAIPKERALEAIAELRRTGVIAIDKSTLWLTEQGNTIVEQLRRSLRKAGKTVAELA